MGVYNGHDAVAAVSSFGADAALIDIGMPGMSGYDIARALRKRYDGAKPLLIAVTAWAKAADRLMARVAGFDHHVGKPYDPNELLMLLGPLKESGPP
jgi:CheY-like chemotaxis protein